MRQPIEHPPSEPDLVRPAPRLSPSENVRDWIEWFGLTRLVTSALAVVVVCVGGWWLLRPPSAPPDSALPVAAASPTPGSVTLPPPSSGPPTAVTEPSSDVDADIVVHVAGAVASPGVYDLPAGSRVDDALRAAGGETEGADPSALNLAAPLVDGTRIYLPVVGEDVPPEVAMTGSAATDDAEPAGPVDVNVATVSALDALPGVGPATAAAIVTERERNGPFVSVADLERVPGIGPAKVAALDGLVLT